MCSFAAAQINRAHRQHRKMGKREREKFFHSGRATLQSKLQTPPSLLPSSSPFHLLFHSLTKTAFLPVACGPHCPRAATFHFSPPSWLFTILKSLCLSFSLSHPPSLSLLSAVIYGRVLEEEANGFPGTSLDFMPENSRSGQMTSN